MMVSHVQYRGSVKLELLRKLVHVLTGIFIVLLFQAHILDISIFGLLILLFGIIVLYNYRAERELLTKILSVNRADKEVPGLDILFYLVGAWLALLFLGVLFGEYHLAYASILVLAFGDSVAHLISRSFGATHTVLTKTTYLEGTVAGIIAASLAAWLYVPWWAALIASVIAMLVEAGELRIGDHHVDDNLIIPLVAGIVLWVMALAFSI